MERFEVHVHSEYSNIRLLDAINKLKSLINRSIELGLAGITLTDHECLSGHIKMNQLTHKVQKENPNFKVALGNEIYLVDTRENGIKYYHFILIAKDKEGHKQLRQLSSLAWLNSYYDRGMERVPTLKEDLRRIVKENPGHLIATTACMGGELSTLALNLYNARQIKDEKGAELYHSQIINFMQASTYIEALIK